MDVLRLSIANSITKQYTGTASESTKGIDLMLFVNACLPHEDMATSSDGVFDGRNEDTNEMP